MLTFAYALAAQPRLKTGRALLVYQSKPVWDSCRAVQAQVGQLQAVQKPLQDVQHRGPLAEDERVVPLFLRVYIAHSALR